MPQWPCAGREPPCWRPPKAFVVSRPIANCRSSRPHWPLMAPGTPSIQFLNGRPPQPKESSEDNCSIYLGICFGGVDHVVPISVERIARNVEAVHLLAGDGNSFRLVRAVEFAFHRQAGLRGGRRDQIDDDAVADQRRGLPVHRDEREQAVLYLVPFARARWPPKHWPVARGSCRSSATATSDRRARQAPPSPLDQAAASGLCLPASYRPRRAGGHARARVGPWRSTRSARVQSCWPQCRSPATPRQCRHSQRCALRSPRRCASPARPNVRTKPDNVAEFR